MASAYIVFIRESSVDEDALAHYSSLVKPIFAGRSVKFHAAYGRQQVLEGPEADGVVARAKGVSEIAKKQGFPVSSFIGLLVSMAIQP